MAEIEHMGQTTAPRRWRTLAEHGGAVLLCVLLLTWALRLWKTDLHSPLVTGGDGFFLQMVVKGLVENGWYLHNPRVGAPEGLDLAEYPLADNLHFGIMKCLSLATSNPSLIINGYFLLTFPLTTLSALFVMRRFQVPYLPALVTSLLFSFLPYHFLRGKYHLFLASYYLVPLMTMVVLWVELGGPFLFHTDQGRLRLSFARGRSLASLVICLLISSAGIYYACFACFFLAVLGLSAGINRRSLVPPVNAAILGGALVVGLLLNLAPTISYRWHHAANPKAVNRPVEGAEIYALKIAQLLLPTDGHRWSVLRELKETYNRSAPLRNENTSASLGVVASIGFLFLVGRYLYRRPLPLRAVPIDCLSLLTLAAVLLGTIGGFGALFGLFFPWVRAYNRISIYIGFFGLFAVAGLLGWAYRLCDNRPYLRRAMACLLLVLLGVGVLDEVPRYDTLIDPASPTTFAADQELVQEIEATLPVGAMVFQLPYMPFPESRPVRAMADYEHLRGYLHSGQLRWSYGVMRGTEGDARYRALATLPPEDMVRAVATAGYRGIYLDRAGYADGGSQLENVLTQLLDVPPLTDGKRRFAFYSLTRYAEGLRQQVARVEEEKVPASGSPP